MRNIALKVLVFMERRLALYITGIQIRSIRKASKKKPCLEEMRKAFNAGFNAGQQGVNNARSTRLSIQAPETTAK